VIPFPYGAVRMGRAVSITPSSSDPDFASVTSLLHFDGTDGSTTFTDQKGLTWTAAGQAQLDTAQFKYGTASLMLDGSGDYISCASDAAFGFGTGDFTIEGWFRAAVISGNMCLLDTRTASNEGIAIYVNAAATGTFTAYSNAGILVGVGSFTLNTWVHFAVVRDAGTVRIYLGGVQQGSAADARTYASASSCFVGDNYVAPSQPANGWLDDLRITKGVCRYPSGTSFTPASSAFPDS
jgi:hypothetical protein